MLIRIAALAAALLATTSAGAIELADPVAGHPGTTYADLVGKFVPNLRFDTEAGWNADIPAPYRYADEAEPGEYADTPGIVLVTQVELSTIRSNGVPMLTVSVEVDGDGGWPETIMGVFTPDLQLVDFARVDLDRFVGFDAPIALSDRDDGLVVRSSHFNAGENYEQTQLVYLANGEITALPSLGAYSIFQCEYQDTVRGDFAATDDGQPGFRPVTATLRADHTLMPDCESFTEPYDDADANLYDETDLRHIDPPWTRVGTATYVWSASLGLYVEKNSDIEAVIGAIGWYDDEAGEEGGE